MIEVEVSPQWQEMMGYLSIPLDRIVKTINQRHRGLVTDALDRLISAHWFGDDDILLVDSVVSRKIFLEGERKQCKFLRVMVQLAIPLRSRLPRGTLSRGMNMTDILRTVAENFGQPLRCHPDASYSPLYEGPWNGKKDIDLQIESETRVLAVCGSFYGGSEKRCELVWAFDLERYLRWVTPPNYSPPPGSSLEFFVLQKRLLEELLPSGWFDDERNIAHPAFIRWNLCQIILNRGGIQFQEDHLPTIARMLYDAMILTQVSGGDPKLFRLGRFGQYGDDKVRRKIRSMVTDPRKFEDVMVELAFGAWHLSKSNHSVTPLEEEGLPDLKLDIADSTLPVYSECKRLTTMLPNRFQRVLRKANNQIKATAERCYGIAVLDVSALVSNVAQTDEVPSEILEICRVVGPIVTGAKNRSLGGVLLLWDDYGVLGVPPEPSLVFLRRRHEFISHSPGGGIETIPDDMELYKGATALCRLDWRPTEETHITVSFPPIDP